MLSTIQNVSEEHNEKLLLIAYFLVVAVVAAQLFQTLGEAWRNSQLFGPVIRAFDPFVSIDLEQFAAFWFGVYLGLLSLFTLDPKKRWQGVLLGFGTFSALFGLLSIGLFIPNIDFADNITFLLGGGLLGAVVGGGRNIMRIQTAEPLEFRRAAVFLFYLISGIIVLGLLEYHVVFPEFLQVTGDGLAVVSTGADLDVTTDGLLFNAILGGVFVVTLKQFIEYDAEESFFVLGPYQSGKSLFVIGLYNAALNHVEGRNTEAPLQPSSDLMDLVSEFDSAGRDDGWEIGATQATDLKNLEFKYLSGRLFPKNLQITSKDYAGEYLEDLPDALTFEGGEEGIDDSTVQVLSNGIESSDTLIFLIDAGRYFNDEPLEINQYFDILAATSDKDVILVVTKADLFAEQFKQDEHLEAHREFEEFREYVNRELVKNDQAAKTLVQDTGGSEIHPVYYQTTEDDRGERVPLRNQNGRVETVGFERLIEKLG